MNLAEMLGGADIAQLARIADAYGCECGGHSKHEFMQAILAAVGSRQQFDAQVDAMTIEELRFLNSLLFDARDAFGLEELMARARHSRFDAPEREAAAPPMKAAAAAKAKGKGSGRKARGAAAGATPPSEEAGDRGMIARFKHRGWLFNGISGTSRYLYHVPEDLKERFAEAMARRLGAAVEPSGEPAAYRDEQSLMVDDVLHLLRFVGQQDIPVTAEGAMYKRTVTQLMEALAVQEEPPAKGAWRFGYGRRFKDYPDRLALLYDYCHYRRWIDEADMRLTLTDAGRAKAESMTRDEPAELYRFWLRLYKGAVPNLPSVVHWIDRLGARWVTLDSLRSALLPYVRPFYYDDAASVFDKRIVAMMLHLGLVRLGDGESAGPALRMTSAGRAIVAGVRVDDRDGIAAN